MNSKKTVKGDGIYWNFQRKIMQRGSTKKPTKNYNGILFKNSNNPKEDGKGGNKGTENKEKKQKINF